MHLNFERALGYTLHLVSIVNRGNLFDCALPGDIIQQRASLFHHFEQLMANKTFNKKRKINVNSTY